MKKILISGGHLTPALALIDYLKENKIESEITFLGRLYSQEINKQESQEKKEVERRNIKFVPFNAPRPNKNILGKIPFLIKLSFAYFKALFLMIKYHPQVFISFGGYLAVPIAIAAWSLGIKVITHEQTVTAGQANIIIGKFAKKIALSHKESAKHFPKQKIIVTGNPIRPDLVNAKPKRPTWAKDLSSNKPTLLITGGNQGSYIINTTISQVLPKIIKTWNVIHACGNPTSKINYQAELNSIKDNLPAGHRKNYVIREWLTTPELAWVYNIADGAVSRSGANTVQELTFAQIPTIFIPLPFSKGNEQLLNAKTITEKGSGVLLEQKNLNAESLLKEINFIKKHQKSLGRKLEPLKPSANGAAKLWEIIEDIT
jgi:UDP-N-acetylglucosamine--N-acetylmuramyl-(pentapeptide) pyrophosphoryl-undecaprenol N-acetylglucosamine transferase